ncbi:MAG: hypothetical protein JNN25_00700 [Candidatus Kapabacteria bacterium]|nr:hypothetical protein [Candidatus Kapabacteria bacterium]
MFHRFLFPLLRIAAYLVFFNAPVVLPSQALQTNPAASLKTLYFEHLPTPSVVQSVVYSIVQDSRGFMWFGTKDGLYRYDGLQSMVFVHNPLDSLSISDNRILNVYEDLDGDLWIATQDGGLNLFQRTTATFKRYQPKSGSTTAIRSNRVAFAYQDRTKIFWVGTENGLHRFDKKQQAFTLLSSNPNDSTSLPSNYIRCVLETQKGELWFGTVLGGLVRYNQASGTFTTFKRNPRNSRTIADNTIHAMTEDDKGILWLGTAHGLSAFNPATAEAVNYLNNPTNSNSLSENIVWDVVFTRSRQLWVGTQNGLNLFRPETQDFMRFTEDIVNIDNGKLPNSYVNALYEDARGRLWVGMYGGGVSIIDPFKRKFDIVRRNVLQNHLRTLPDNNIWAVYQDNNSLVWIGTVHGLAAYNPQTKEIRAFHTDTVKFGSMSDNINFLTGDSQGKIWCSTYGGGINVFDASKGKYIAHYGYEEGNPRSLPNDRATVVYCAKDKQMWVGTVDGACRFVPKTNDFEPEYTGLKGSSRLTHQTIKYFFEDSKGRFWIGTASGLNLVDRATGNITRFKGIPTDTTTLSHNNIRQILEDAEHRIWIATSGGLNLLIEPVSGKAEDISFRRITTANGLRNNLVSGVLTDSRNMLWIPHGAGICSFDPVSFRVVREFDTEDGLQGQEFRATAITNLRGGGMFFGGANGFNLFTPSSLSMDSTIPRIVLTNFKVLNQDRRLPVHITEAREITLSYKDYIFSFEFAALDFTNSTKTRYAYKMEGFDQEWVQNGNLRSATYTNLKGGEYTFRVKASNHDGVWNEEGIALKVIIVPPFWETWWFRGAGVCVLLGIIVVGIGLRERGIKRQNVLLEAMVAERTSALKVSNNQLSEANEQLRLANVEKNEFLGIVAHDLKNPLSTIQLAANFMHKNTDSLRDKDIQEMSGDILITSNRMFDLITNLLDVNKLEQNAITFVPASIDIVGLVRRSVMQYTPQADAKSLHFRVESADESMTAFVNENATMQVIDNIISNAVKYSPQGKNITIRLQSRAGVVRMEVQDEGEGISPEDMQKLFGKFVRLSARPTGGEHSTGLGLSIVKKMVEAMQGRVWCESELGKGATFIVELPCV